MNNSLFFVTIFLLSMNVNAQWMALDYGVDFGARTLVYDSASSKLFVGGNFRYASGILTNGVAVWDGAVSG